MGWAGTYPLAYSGTFFCPSVNKIQLFTSVQMQPLAVCLCNDHIHPLGPDILWETKVKVKILIRVLNSNKRHAHQAPPWAIPPPADTLEKQVQS